MARSVDQPADQMSQAFLGNGFYLAFRALLRENKIDDFALEHLIAECVGTRAEEKVNPMLVSLMVSSMDVDTFLKGLYIIAPRINRNPEVMREQLARWKPS